MSKSYVVCVYTAVQDGHDEYEKVVPSLEAALAYINDNSNPWGATNTFKLFELGPEVPLDCKTEIVPQPVPEPEQKQVYQVFKSDYSSRGIRRR